MRELSTPSLFDPVPLPSPVPVEEHIPDERRGDKLAKDFTRWCFSFGSDFRNSPDVLNLRAWCRKARLKLRDTEEAELLVEARRLYLRRIEQMMRKSDPAALKPAAQTSEAPA